MRSSHCYFLDGLARRRRPIEGEPLKQTRRFCLRITWIASRLPPNRTWPGIGLNLLTCICRSNGKRVCWIIAGLTVGKGDEAVIGGNDVEVNLPSGLVVVLLVMPSLTGLLIGMSVRGPAIRPNQYVFFSDIAVNERDFHESHATGRISSGWGT